MIFDHEATADLTHKKQGSKLKIKAYSSNDTVTDSKYLGNSRSEIPEKSSIFFLAAFVNMLCSLLSLDNKQGMCASKTQTIVIIQKAVFVLLRSLVLAKPTCRLVDFTQIMAPNSYLTLSSLNGSSSATFVVGDELSSTITKFFHKEYS